MRLKIFYWGLYDFANSILLIAFLFYFSQWFVVEQGNPAWWYNFALVGASLLFIVVAPTLTRKIDTTGEKVKSLRLWTASSFLIMGAVSLVAMLSNSLDYLALALYILGMFVYLVCFLYFTPMLNDLSDQENRGRVSGIGQGLNSLGQVVGLLVTLPFVQGSLTLFGETGRAQALLPAVLLFGLFSLPLLFWYKETPTPSHKPHDTRKHKTIFQEILSYRPLVFALGAYFLFSDALLTSVNNFPLYLEQVHQVGDTTKALLTVAILGLAAVGSVWFGRLADRHGHVRVLRGILFAYCIIFPTMAFLLNLSLLIPVFLLAGLLFGPVWGVSRALVGKLAPPHIAASSYGYYVVAERFATLTGPLVWGGMLFFVGENFAGYQAAFLSMTVILFCSVLILNRVTEPRATMQ